jgi:hypothetical protein
MNGTFFVLTNRTIADISSIINYINKHEGIEWMPFEDMAKEFLEGRIQGVEIEGGAEVEHKAD